MKLALVALVALLVLGGGAAGAYFYFSKPAEAAANADQAAHAEETKKEAKKDDHGDGHGGPSSNVSFVRMDPLVLPIIDGSGVNQVVSLVIVLEVDDQFIATEVRRLTPRLKDAYIQNMYGMLNRKASMEGGVLKVSDIKKRLNDVTDKVMGKGAVNDVLLEVVQQRPI